MSTPRTQQLVLASLHAYPNASVREIARRLCLREVRVRQVLAHLEAYGRAEGTVPPLMQRGKRYRLVGDVAAIA